MKKTAQRIVAAPGKAKVSRSELKTVVRNPVRVDEDEADYQYSVAALLEDRRLVSAEAVWAPPGALS